MLDAPSGVLQAIQGLSPSMNTQYKHSLSSNKVNTQSISPKYYRVVLSGNRTILTATKIDFQKSKASISAAISASLANNIRDVGKYKIQGFQNLLTGHLKTNQDYFLQNVDALSLAHSRKKSIELDSYYLSSIVSKIESNHPDFKAGNGVKACNCGHRVMPTNLQNKIFKTLKNESKDATVDVIEYNNTYSYQGVMHCNNVWGCPVCSRKLSERRKEGLARLLRAHHKDFGEDSITMSLFTVPHGLGDDLSDILKRISKAFRQMIQSTGYKNLTKKFNVCGTARNLEVTYGTTNGFHPHIHCLHFFEQSVFEDLEEISETLFQLWSNFLKKNGFSEPSTKGFGCSIVSNSATQTIAKYLTKVEDISEDDLKVFNRIHAQALKNKASGNSWGVEHEMTKWHLKKGKETNGEYSYTMFDFLRGYELASILGDDESRTAFYSLWLKYRAALKGKIQLFTKHKHFRIEELEQSDDELGEAKPEDNVAKPVLSIPFDIWQLIVLMKARGTVLKMIKQDGVEGFDRLIELLKIGYEALPEDKKILHFDDS